MLHSKSNPNPNPKVAPDEVMAAVHIPRPPPGVRMGAYKVSKRPTATKAMDHAAFAYLKALKTAALLSYKGPLDIPARHRAARYRILKKVRGTVAM